MSRWPGAGETARIVVGGLVFAAAVYGWIWAVVIIAWAWGR